MNDPILLYLTDDIVQPENINYEIKHKLFKIGKKNDICSICFEDFKKNDLVYNLSCPHIYHKSCLELSVRFAIFSCPICRQPLNITKKNKHEISYDFNKKNLE